ncbi:hypothetical protein ACSPKE_004271, partial [Providencia stuartii]
NKAIIENIVVGSDLRSKNYDQAQKKGMRLDFKNQVFENYSVVDGSGTEIDADGIRVLFNGNWVVNMGKLL